MADIFGNVSAPGFSLSDEWNAALVGFGVNDSYWTPRTADTVPSNALQAMQPIETNSGGAWGDFFKTTLQTALGYSIAKDAVKSGVAKPAQQYGQPAYAGQAGGAYVQRPAGGNQLLLLGGLGVVVYLLARR